MQPFLLDSSAQPGGEGKLGVAQDPFRETAVARLYISLLAGGLGVTLCKGIDARCQDLYFPGQCSIQSCPLPPYINTWTQSPQAF